MMTVAVMTKMIRRDRIVDATWTTIDQTMMMPISTRRGENVLQSGIITGHRRRDINTRVTRVREEALANETETESETGIVIVIVVGIVVAIEVGIVMQKARRRHRRHQREEIDLKTDHIISLVIYFLIKNLNFDLFVLINDEYFVCK